MAQITILELCRALFETGDIDQIALTLAEQRKLPGYDVLGNAGISGATPYGSRRYAKKVCAIWLTLSRLKPVHQRAMLTETDAPW